MQFNRFARFFGLFVAFSFFMLTAKGQCPTLNSNATMTPCSGPGCNVCPGQTLTISGLTATNLTNGSCVNWYLGTTPTFNPFNGQGTLLGCSPITVAAGSPCTTCPNVLFIFVDDCPGGQVGGQEDNEFLMVWSGSGFNVSDANLNFDANNNGGVGNGDVGFGVCDWQMPSPTVMSSLTTACPAANLIAVGPGDVVPPDVPVLVFASAGMNYSYNWGSLCPLAPTIYVMQNGCDRTIGGFSNSSAVGNRTSEFSLDCGCTDAVTYNCQLLVGGNGALFTDLIPPPLGYQNFGCGFPPGVTLPPGGGGGVITVPPFMTTVDASMCNGGPYYIVGASDVPLPPGCTGDLSNYLQFNVPCPAVTLNPATVCESNGAFNLSPLVVGGVAGTWSGPGVSGNFFNANGQGPGPVVLDFTPTSTCQQPATTTITVKASPTADLTWNPATICSGQNVQVEITFSGTGPWTFVPTFNGGAQAAITTSSNPYLLTVPNVTGPVTVALESVTAGGCPGTVMGGAFLEPSPPETAMISGGGSFCGSGSTTLEIEFTGDAPWTFVYRINGVAQAAITTSLNPYFLNVSPAATTTYTLASMTSAPCGAGSVSGSATVTVATAPQANFSTAAATTCGPGLQTILPIQFVGGTAPWTVVYSANGSNLPPVVANSNPYNLSVTPSVSTTYEIVSVAANGCTGTSNSTVTVTVGTPPQAAISGGGQICGGQTEQIEVEFFNGSAPWTFVYAQNGVAQASVAANSNPYILNVSPTATTNYTLVSVASNGCTGSVSGTASVAVTALPTAQLSSSGSSSICGAGPIGLTVLFGGTNPGPWTVFYTANGVAQTPVLVNSNPGNFNVTASQSTTYTLTSVSANGCSGTASGSLLVTVETVAATLAPAAATVCQAGQTANLTVSFSGTAPAPFEFGYSINGVAQAPITTSLNPYTLSVPVSAASTVVLTSVQSTPNFCNGTASGSTSLSINGPTAAFASSTTSFCGAGNPANLTVNFTGQAPWTFSFSENGTPQPPVTTSVNQFTLVVTPSVSSTYTLTAVSSSGCTGSATGTATVNITTPPTANLTGSATVCAGSQVPLSVNFSGGTAPWTFSYTENGTQKGPITTTNDPYILNVAPTVTTNYVLTAVASGTCAGTATGTANVTVFPTLTAQILGGATIAPGGSAQLQLSLPGAPAGVTINYTVTANGVDLPTITTTANPYLLNVSPTVSTTYAIKSCTVGPCPMGQTGSALVTVVSAFSAQISGNDTLCKGEQAVLRFDFAGAATPFSFIYSINGVAQPAISTSNNPHFLNVSPTVTSVYELVSASAGAQSGTVSGMATVVVNAPFLLLAGGTQTICAGDQTTVNVSLQNNSGTPPFTFQLTENGSATAPIVSTGASFGFSVSPTVSTTYQLFSGSANGCAAGLSTATLQVNVTGPPTANNVQINCNQAAGTYTVSFDLSSPASAGVPMVNGQAVAAGPFTSGAIPQSQNYAFSLENDCGTSNLSGQNTCACATDAGTMTSLDTVKACGGAITVSHQNDQVLEGGDLFRFMLHTTPSIPIGQVLLIKDLPTFSFDPASMSFNTVYYISAVAGDGTTGFIDFNDPCLSVAVGTPVMWTAPPFATLTALDTTICKGTVAQLNIAFQGTSAPPFTFTYTRNGVPAPQVTTNQTNYSIGAFLNQTTTFQVVALSASGCPAQQLPPPVKITVIGPPQVVGNPTEACDLTTGTYTVSAIIGGGNGQYLFSGGGGAIIGQALVSQPIPIGMPYQYLIYDTEQCGSDTISGLPACACATNAGIFPTLGPVIFCADEADTLQATVGQVIEPDDTLIYVLHTETGPNPQLWTILATNSVPYFTFNPGLIEPDSSYFISAVAANLTPAGIDLGDPCLSISPGLEIKWKKPVSGFLSDNIEICQGDSTVLTFTFSGDDAPYEFDFFKNGLLQPKMTSLTDTFRLTVAPMLSANYSLNSVKGATCDGSINGGGGAAVSVRLPAFPVDLAVDCDFSAQTYTITFKISNGADTAKTYSTSGTGGFLTADTVFTSVPIPFGQPYSVTILNPIGCEVLVEGIGQCVCTTNAGTMTVGQALDACIGAGPAVFLHNGDEKLDPDDTTLKFILFSDEMDPKGSILARSGFPAAFAFNPATMVAGQIYFVAAVAGDPDGLGSVDLNDPCLSISPPVTIVFHEPPTAAISGAATVCPGDPASVEIDFEGTGPFVFRYSINGAAGPSITTTQNPFEILASAPLVDLAFTLVSVSDAFCAGTVSGIGQIDVLPQPTGQIFGENSICPTFSTPITVVLSGAPAFDIVMSDGQTFSNVSGSFNFPVSPSATTTYSIASLTPIGSPCPAVIVGQPATVTVAGLELELTESSFSNGFNISCAGAKDGSVSVATTGGQPPYSFEWSYPNEAVTGPAISGQDIGWYQVTVSDAQGCKDSIWTVLDEPGAITLDWRAESPACFGDLDGQLTIENVLGASEPIRISLNGNFTVTTDSLPLTFSGLAAGAYSIEVTDQNGCRADFPATVDATAELLVNLGPDIDIQLGDSVLLKGQTSVPVDSFLWSPVKFLSTPKSLETWAKPFSTQLFELRVWDEKGCTGRDQIFVRVDPTVDIYAPTAFAPESDDNDRFTLFAGPQVAEITDFRIFDRWGDMVFKNENFQPGDPQKGWDGSARGQKGAVAVYVWWAKVALVDGSSIVVKGDVTLVR